MAIDLTFILTFQQKYFFTVSVITIKFVTKPKHIIT